MLLLVENVGEEIDRLLWPLFQHRDSPYIQFGEINLMVPPEFKLFVLSRLCAPRFQSEVLINSAVINFSINSLGLEAQILSIIANYKLSVQETKLSSVKNEALSLILYLDQIEQNILKQLQADLTSILLSDALVEDLSNSVAISKKTIKKLLDVRCQEKELIKERNKLFRTVQGIANLYLFSQQLVYIDPIYQFSLSWFKDIVSRELEKLAQNKMRKKKEEVEEDLLILITKSFYLQLIIGIKEKDRVATKVALTIKKIKSEGMAIDKQQLKFVVSSMDYGRMREMGK